MGSTIALIVYYLASASAMMLALYLWRDLSVARERARVRAGAVERARLVSASEQQSAAAAEERQQWASEFQHAREHIERLRHEIEQLRAGAQARWSAFDEMCEVWGKSDAPSKEADAKALLRDNMWVLEPEFCLIDERIDWEVNLTNALKTLYGTFAAIDNRVWKTPPDLAQLVDIAAVVSMDGTLGTSRTHAGDESDALLLIEAKRPGPAGVLNEAARDQVLGYAADLRKLAPDILMGRRIECLLIGGSIPPRMNDVVVKWDSEGEAPTMVRFLTWETLLRRAERACQLAGPRPQALHLVSSGGVNAAAQ